MKNKKWIDFLLYSNIFISICAATITTETYLLIHSEINWLYIAFVFFSTLFLYDFPSLYFAEEAFSANQSERHKWILENRNTLIGFSAISFLVISITVFFFPLKFILLMIPNAVLAFAYFFPQTRLRSITGLKAAVVAVVWTMVTYVYPLLLCPLTCGESWRGVSERFLFMLPLCIIFNVRDIEADRIAGVRTIPVVYGTRATIIICLISLLLFSILVFFHRRGSAETMALIASAIVSAILILKSSHNKHDYFYSFWIDGMIILQAGLVVMTSILL
ncbi:MAG: UbiA family prenyltransferase [Bacteroidetes bacterium]|nr:UbiA family prenyltransferase [Bacteroidota bacterium]